MIGGWEGRTGKRRENVFKSVIVRNFIFSFKKMLQNVLAAGLRSDPLGELKLSHRPLISSEGYGREYSLAAIRGLCGEGEG